MEQYYSEYMMKSCSNRSMDSSSRRRRQYYSSWELEEAFAEDGDRVGGFVWPPRSYSCSLCTREFRSAQALGGHMNVHRRQKANLNQTHHHVTNTLLVTPQINHHNNKEKKKKSSSASLYSDPPPPPPAAAAGFSAPYNSNNNRVISSMPPALLAAGCSQLEISVDHSSSCDTNKSCVYDEQVAHHHANINGGGDVETNLVLGFDHHLDSCSNVGGKRRKTSTWNPIMTGGGTCLDMLDLELRLA